MKEEPTNNRINKTVRSKRVAFRFEDENDIKPRVQ